MPFKYVAGSNACSVNNGNCSHFCLPVPGGRECACPDCQTNTTCPRPSSPSHGAVSPSGSAVACGESVQYTCDNGYTLVGSTVNNCNGCGWTTQAPVCNVPCGQPGAVDNGKVHLISGTAYVYKSTVEVTCGRGFQLNGTAVRQCEADGNWSGTAPTCLEIECPLPDVPANANVTHSAGRYVGEKAVYVCQHGYDLVGSNIRVCQSDGSWSPSPKCISNTAISGLPITTIVISVGALLAVLIIVFVIFFCRGKCKCGRRPPNEEVHDDIDEYHIYNYIDPNAIQQPEQHARNVAVPMEDLRSQEGASRRNGSDEDNKDEDEDGYLQARRHNVENTEAKEQSEGKCEASGGQEESVEEAYDDVARSDDLRRGTSAEARGVNGETADEHYDDVARSDDQQEGACGGVPVENESKEHQNTYLELIGGDEDHDTEQHQTAEYSYAYADKRFICHKRPHE